MLALHTQHSFSEALSAYVEEQEFKSKEFHQHIIGAIRTRFKMNDDGDLTKEIASGNYKAKEN